MNGKKEDWPSVFGWKFFVVLFALSQIGLVWEYRSRERCIAVNNKVLMFLLDSDNHENGEYVGCCSSMKPGNLGDSCAIEMYISKNYLYKYMYFFVQNKLKVCLFSWIKLIMCCIC